MVYTTGDTGRRQDTCQFILSSCIIFPDDRISLKLEVVVGHVISLTAAFNRTIYRV
jgi:hypothetical protein